MKSSIRIGATIGGIGGALYIFMSENLELLPFMICMARVG